MGIIGNFAFRSAAGTALCLMAGLVMGPSVAAQTPAAEIPCNLETRTQAWGTMAQLHQGKAELAKTIGAFEAAAQACPEDAVLQHYAAQTQMWAAMQVSQTGGGLQAVVPFLLRAQGFSDAYWALPQISGEGRWMSYAMISDLRQDIVQSMFDLHSSGAQAVPYIAEGPPGPDCARQAFSDIMGASSWSRKNPDKRELGLAFADQWLALCPLSDRKNINIHKSTVSMKLFHADQIVETDPDRAQALVDDVNAYRSEILAGTDEGTGYGWKDSDQMRLSKLVSQLPLTNGFPTGQDDPLQSATELPVDQWFRPDTPSHRVTQAIGRTLNVYIVQEGEAAGFARGMGKMYKLAEAAPDRDLARSRLYSGIQFYARDNFRTQETRDVEIIRAYYDWLKPEG